VCVDCQLAAYCSRECQRQHRKVHKRVCTHLRDFTIGTAAAANSAAQRDAITDMLKRTGMPFSILTAEQIDHISEHGTMPQQEKLVDQPRCFANMEATVTEEQRRRWVAIGSDVQQWLNRSERVLNVLRHGDGFVYAVVFEKEAAESEFLKLSASGLPGHSYFVQHTVGNFASELGSNPNLKLAVFEMRMHATEYKEQMLNIDWPSIPSARMLTAMVVEKAAWASRLLSV